MNVCYYHRGDLDGLCSAAIVKKFASPLILIGMDYNDKAIPMYPKDAERIFIVDFSFQPIGRMRQFVDDAGYDRVAWIDHHKSAIEESRKVGLDRMAGLRDTGRAACELTWAYLDPHGPVPKSVFLLGRWDVWDHAHEGVMAFQYGMRAKASNPDSSIWGNILGDEPVHQTWVDHIISNGDAILEFIRNDNKKYARTYAFETDFHGHKAVCLNRGGGSQIFEGMYDPSRHELMIAFVRQGGRWRISLFSESPHIDCSALALRYEGGGHKGAAGFMTDTLPFRF